MEIILIYIFLIFLGAVIGFMTGSIGLGGGFLMVPILIYVFQGLGIPEDKVVAMAVGTSLSVIFVTSIKGAYEHYKNENILLRYSLLLGVSGILGTFIGVNVVTNYLDGTLHKMLFGIILLILSLNMAFNKSSGEFKGNFKNSYYVIILITGFLIGIISSIFGIGGGTIAIPILSTFLKMPIKKSIGTSLGMMAIISFGGFFGYLTAPLELADSYKYLNFIGYVSLSAAISISISSIIFSKYGAKFSKQADSNSLKRFFAALLFLVGLKMVI